MGTVFDSCLFSITDYIVKPKTNVITMRIMLVKKNFAIGIKLKAGYFSLSLTETIITNSLWYITS